MTSRFIGPSLFRILSVLSFISILSLSAAGVSGVELFWRAPSGGDGTWDTATALWYTDAGGASAPQVWNNAAGDDAYFPTGSPPTGLYTVTIQPTGISVHNITIQDSATLWPVVNITDGTATGTNGYVLSLVGTTPTIAVNTTSPYPGGSPGGISLRVTVGGTSGLTKTGAGYLDLFAANTYSGVTDIQQGWIDPQNDLAFGTSSVVVQDGAWIWTWGDQTVNRIRTLANAITLTGVGNGNGALQANGSNGAANCRVTLNGPITIVTSATMGAVANGNGGDGNYLVNNTVDGSATNATLTFNSGSNANSVFNGAITLGAGSLVRTWGTATTGGTGAMVLVSTANSWTGGTDIQSGALQVGDGGATGSLPDAGFISLGATGVLTFNSTNDFTFTTAPLLGTGTLNKLGSGNVTLSTDNSAFSGPVNIGAFNAGAGALRATTSTALGAGTVTVNGGTSAARLELDNTGAIFNFITLAGRAAPASAHIVNVAGANTLASDITTATSGSEYVIQSDAGSLTIQANINNALGTTRTLTLQGAANGEVQGAINNTGSGTLNLAKSGAGTWTISSAFNTYNGSTTVNGGTLALGSTASIAASPTITVKSGAILDVSAVGGGFKLASGQSVGGAGTVNGSVGDTASGAVSVVPGEVGGTATLTFNNALALNSGAGDSIKFDLRQTPTDPLGTDIVKVLGNFNSSNPSKINLNFSLLQPSVSNATWPLIQYASWTGAITDFTTSGLPSLSRQSFTIANNAGLKQIELQVIGTPAVLTWVGGLAGNAWDINTTKNWFGAVPPNVPTAQFYFDGDLVTFDDTGSNSPNINIVSKVQPGSLTFNNSTKNYTLVSTGGAGYISGGTALTKSGTGKVTLATVLANDFTGPIVINAGTLQIGDGVNSGGIAGTQTITNNGALIINRPDSSTISGLISGTGSVTQQGAGSVLTLSAANSYTGATTISGGTLAVASLANGGANSNIGASTSNAGNLVINGGTLAYTGAAVTTNRLFTMGASGATIDASGTGGLTLSNTGTMGLSGSGARTLTLTGTATATNTIWAAIGNAGGATNIYKSGAGYWVLANNGINNSSYTGNIVVDGGILQAFNQSPSGSGNGLQQTYRYTTAFGAATNTLTINAGGAASIWCNAYATWVTKLAGVTLNGGTLMADDGHQAIDAPVNFTTDSTLTCRWWDKDLILMQNLTGTGNLTINAPFPAPLTSGQYNYGTVILAGAANNWTGQTIITGWTGTNQNRSTLQIGNAGVGSMPLGAGNAITINTGATLAFNTTNNITIGDALNPAQISGGGWIANQGSGTLVLSGNNPGFTGALLPGAGGGVSGLYYSAIGLTTNPALNTGVIRVTDTTVFGGSTQTYWAAIGGSLSTARLELGGGTTDVTTPSTLLWLNGRQPDNTTSMLVSLGHTDLTPANNIIQGTVNLGANGNTYVIESKNHGDTLTFNAANALVNTNANTTLRYVTLKGAGNFVFNGLIGPNAVGGTNSNIVLIKSGMGTATLNAVNTYTGNTTVNGGTLALGSLAGVPATIAVSPVITVNAGATLDATDPGRGGVGINLAATQTLAGSGLVKGDVATVAGSTVAPGGSIGTLTFNNNLTLAGSDNINYEVSGAGDDLISVVGNLNLNGDSALGTATMINFGVWGSEPALGNHQVAGAGALNAVAVPANNAVTVVNQTRYIVTSTVTPGAAGRIDVNVAGTNSTLTWAGTGANVWDVATTNPWTGGAAGDNKFYQADRVLFDSTDTQPAVSISTVVRPLSVTVSGASNYNFSGTGRISGSTGFTMNGTGSVTLGTTNDYYGTTSVTSGTLIISGSVGPNSPISITGGTLRIGGNNALGDNSQVTTAATTINGGTLDINGYSVLNVRNEPVFVRGSGSGVGAAAGAIVNNVGTAVYEAFHFVTMTGDTTFGGTAAGGRWEIGRWTTGGVPVGYLRGNNFTLTKAGPNNVWLNNLGSVDLKGLVINGGELTIEWDNAFVGTVLVDSSVAGPAPGGFGYTPITINAGGQFGMWGRPAPGNNTPQAIAGTGPILYSNVTLNGGGIGGTQADTLTPQTYAGTINLTANSFVYAATPTNGNERNTDTYFTGAITGTGSLTKPASLVVGAGTNTDTGVVYFTGSASNTYNGATNIYAGTLNLQKSGGATAIPGNLNIGDGGVTANSWDVVNLGAGEQIANSGVVTFNGASGSWAYLNLMGFNETVGGIQDASTFGIIQIQDTSTVNIDSTFTVNTAASTSYSFNGMLRDKYAGAGTGKLHFVKDGPGTQILTGSQITYTGNTTVQGGGLLDMSTVNLNTPNSTVTVTGAGSHLIAKSIIADTLTGAAGGLIEIAPITGGPLGGVGMAAVPEPATWIMLVLAGMGLGIYWRRSR